METQTKTCTRCHKEQAIDQFIGVKLNVTKACSECREKDKIRDARRDKEHRNAVARVNEEKPERKAVKAKWNEENYDKVAKKWMKYRQKKIDTLGVETYLKVNAEYAKEWRDKNPDKVTETNEDKKSNKKNQYSIYKKSADNKNLEFTITYEQYDSIVNEQCYYCHMIQERGFNGIDRKNQTLGYVFDNCTSCCKMCNYMKGSTSDVVFLKRMAHIVRHQDKIEGQLYPECFANHKGGSYDSYKQRAAKKQLEFTLTMDEYNAITRKDCFICGKQTDICHKNGLDRMDSDKGYIVENLHSCCGECNYIKKDYYWCELMEKCKMIYNAHENSAPDNVDTGTGSCAGAETTLSNHFIVKNTNKKSKDEIREQFEETRQEKREILANRYTDEEFVNLRAAEIAAKRAMTR